MISANDIEHARAEVVTQLRIMSDADLPIADMLSLLSETDRDHLAVAVGVLGAICFAVDEPTVKDVLQHLVELIERPTCEFIPNDFLTAYDGKDRLITYGEPSPDCDSFSCSRCGYELMYEEGGGYSWFMDSYPYKPNGLHFCPGCGAAVLFPWSWLDKKEVE